jgi:MFS family permease
MFAYAGIMGFLAQCGTGSLVRSLGEPKLIAINLFLVAISLAALSFFASWVLLYFLLTLLAVGSSLIRPPVFGMISNLTSEHEQGVTIGIAQSMSALARILGPAIVIPLFYHSSYLPYVICAAVSLVAGLIAWQRLSRGYVPHVAVEVPEAPA